MFCQMLIRVWVCTERHREQLLWVSVYHTCKTAFPSQASLRQTLIHERSKALYSGVARSTGLPWIRATFELLLRVNFYIRGSDIVPLHTLSGISLLQVS